MKHKSKIIKRLPKSARYVGVNLLNERVYLIHDGIITKRKIGVYWSKGVYHPIHCYVIERL